MKSIPLLAALVLAGIRPAGAAPLQAIRVSDNGHYFVKADGTPFFWQADTAWAIFNHAAPADVDAYLDDRKAKGFNVIQGVIALWDYTRHRNPDGELPFVNGDLGQINEAFYKNVDSILDKVEAHGMYMAVLPYWHKNAGDRLATDGIPEKMQAYCKFLAQRYAKRNIFWILGGDSTAAGEAGEKIQHITDLEAQGLIEGAKAAGVDKIMISYHPTGRQSSSFWFHNSPWLDFNSIQSGHFIDTTDFQLVGEDYVKTAGQADAGYGTRLRKHHRPALVGTPGARRLQAVDVRRSAYLDVFAGAAGLTYGQGEVYGFAPGGAVTTRWGTAMSWKEALKLPASGQVQYIRELVESRPNARTHARPIADRRRSEHARRRAHRGHARRRWQLRLCLSAQRQDQRHRQHRQAFRRRSWSHGGMIRGPARPNNSIPSQRRTRTILPSLPAMPRMIGFSSSMTRPKAIPHPGRRRERPWRPTDEESWRTNGECNRLFAMSPRFTANLAALSRRVFPFRRRARGG